jgi:hypothetical protein
VKTSPLHSLTQPIDLVSAKSAKRRRKLVQTPVYNSYALDIFEHALIGSKLLAYSHSWEPLDSGEWQGMSISQMTEKAIGVFTFISHQITSTIVLPAVIGDLTVVVVSILRSLHVPLSNKSASWILTETPYFPL